MVNRRLLRVKAFQQMYAYWTQERAQHQLAFDELTYIFLPDLSLMIVKEEQMPRLEGLRKLAEIQLTEFFQGIPTEESDENRRLLENNTKTSLFKNNKILAVFPKWKSLQVAFKDNHIGWSEDEETRLKKLFIEAILVDQTFLDYLPNAGKNFEDDLEIIKYILKNFLLKHPSMTEFFEEKDLNWNLNKDVVKSMSTKTFKIDALEDLSLQPLALQWEDDKRFFEDLYEFTLDSDKDLNGWVEAQTKNWESDRLAMTDFILLKMAIAEMIKFPSIPVKVSINEYIELAKNYSTPKSGQFINGILDEISIRLMSEKIIQKSGRGLIDIASK